MSGTHHPIRLEKGYTDEEYKATHTKMQNLRERTDKGEIFVLPINAVSEGHFLKDDSTINEFENKYEVLTDIKIVNSDGKYPIGSLYATIFGRVIPIFRKRLNSKDSEIIEKYLNGNPTNIEYLKVILGTKKRKGLYFDIFNGDVLMYYDGENTIKVALASDTDVLIYLASTYYSFNKEKYAADSNLSTPDGSISYKNFIKSKLTFNIGLFTEEVDGETKFVTEPSNRYVTFGLNDTNVNKLSEEMSKVEKELDKLDIKEEKPVVKKKESKPKPTKVESVTNLLNL